ncbi:MAG: DUF3426 domain-containing protein [Formivibrio sp.]|nr:DUF3426 domain-containing protein [Formivibrio sp.]
MDHITRCPNCSTAFRVTDEQLAAYHGQVRCGRCAFVFDALDCLLPPAAPSADETPAPPEPVDTTPIADLYKQLQTDLAEEAEALAHFSHPVTSPELPAATKALDHATLVQAATPSFTEEAPDALMETAPETPEQMARAKAEGYRPIALPEDDALFAPLPIPRHRGVWIFATLFAGLVLCLQIVFYYRVTLAMEYPALQPRFTRLCNTLGCSMPLPHQADQLRLEWSELTYVPDHPTLIQLSATLRNLAQYEQALPLLELTLTDNQEHVVAKRIFKPAEYLNTNEKTRQSLPGHDELHAFLQLETGDLKSSGYSLFWFY